MLGQDLMTQLRARHAVVPLRRSDADITDLESVRRAIGRSRPDVVIHTAAFTAVDDCERQPELAFAVNGSGTRNMAVACRQDSVAMLYISTDYVFDGTKASPYVEEDPPNPINVYGRSKFEGELQVRDLVARYWIVRTSWLFGPRGKNFVRAILGRAERGEALRVVDDQVGAPTYTMDLAEKLEQIVESGKAGVYHVTNQGYCSWFDFAREILSQTSFGNLTVSPVPTSALGRPAPRPRNSCLSNAHLQSSGWSLPRPWQKALSSYLLREASAKVHSPLNH